MNPTVLMLSAPPPSTVPVTAVQPGDLIEYHRHIAPMKIVLVGQPYDCPGLYLLHNTRWGFPLAVHKDAHVVLLHAPRTAELQCLVCSKGFKVDYDAAQVTLPVAAICGECV